MTVKGALMDAISKKNLLVSIVVFIRNVGVEGFEFWTQKRLESGPLYGKMEFPGGKIEAMESPEEAARREVFEEVGFEIPDNQKLHLFKQQQYSSETKNICLYVYFTEFQHPKMDNSGWTILNYESKSSPYKGVIPEINHVFIDEMAVYIETNVKNNCWQYL